MRIQMKKLMSFLLAVGILAGSLKFSGKVFAADDTLKITLNGNGGKFTGSVSDNYNPGDALPSYEDITRDNLIFAGWYDNAEFAGNPVYSVPADVSGDTTYYAKWVKPYTVFDNFDDESVSKSWKDNAKATDNDLTPNVDADNSYSGEKALKYQVSSKWGGYVFTNNSFHIDGDGIYFWIKTEKDITVKLELNYNKINTNTIGVPAGKSFVFVPWSIFGDKLDGITDLWAFQIDITAAVDDVIYLDDIGTYSNLAGNITFGTDGGELINSVPVDYYPGMTLPNYENITKGNLIFAGWYDNAEFTGNPVYSVPAGASGDITYYAKWVKQHSLTYNFDNMNWVDWSVNTSISANTDAENAYSGNTSMKYVVPKETIGNMCATSGLMYEGDGISFWIKAEKATTLHLQFKANGNIVSEKIAVTAGKNFVAIPWPKTVTPDSNGWAGSLQIIVDKAAEDNTVYIDDVGTYSDSMNISFELNEGKFSNDVPEKYYIGDTLPNYENITKGNLIFAGWYDNAEFTGNPVYSVPAGASGDITYYAKWVKQHSLTYNFDNMNWVDWSVNTSISANTDAENAYSGNTSMKYVIPKETIGNMCATSGLMYEGDGISFWIKAEKATTLHLQFNGNGNIISEKITVAAGKNFVAISWPKTVTPDSNGWAGSLQIITDKAAEDNTVYIDDVGTYSNAGAHAFANGICSECGAVEFDYNGDKECDIRDLVRLKRYLTDDSVDIKKSNDDNGTVENNDLVKLQKRLLGIS